MSLYEFAGVGERLDGSGVGEGVGGAETNGVGVGYQYMTGLLDDPVALTVVGEPAHAATVAMTNDRAPSSFQIPATAFGWPPNGLRLSGDGGEANGIRCSRW